MKGFMKGSKSRKTNHFVEKATHYKYCNFPQKMAIGFMTSELKVLLLNGNKGNSSYRVPDTHLLTTVICIKKTRPLSPEIVSLGALWKNLMNFVRLRTKRYNCCSPKLLVYEMQPQLVNTNMGRVLFVTTGEQICFSGFRSSVMFSYVLKPFVHVYLYDIIYKT